MALKYYDARASITQSPSSDWKESYQEYVNYEFENSSDIYTIQEELVSGTQVFTDVEVKIEHAIDSATGTKLGDDYRAILFKNFDHAKGLGYRYSFDNNIWLCSNSDLYKFVTASTTIRRCNNVLKWVDTSGVLREEPCIIDYEFSGTSGLYDQSININSGNLVVIAQYNQYTSMIDVNDRFLFGGQAWKVKAMNNFMQNQSGVQSTVPLIKLNVTIDSLKDGDDKANNIPASDFNYTISTDISSIDQSIGYTTQAIASVKLNGEVVSEPVSWISSDTNIATVDSSGNIELISDGGCVITASMTNNSNINTNINVVVQAVPVVATEVRISPNVTEILEGQSQSYSCNLYVNGVLTASSFTFTPSGANTSNYELIVIDGNNFTIVNKRFTSSLLNINAYDGVNSGEIDIKLKGAW